MNATTSMTEPISVEDLARVLDSRFHGVLKAGKHAEDGECGALELLSVVRAVPWTDDPAAVGAWDLRRLNDIPVSDEVRTRHILPVLAAYADARSWPVARQCEVAGRLAMLTINRLVAGLPGLPPAIAERCRRADTLHAAYEAAAHASAAYNAAAVSYAAYNAYESAAHASSSAAYAAAADAYKAASAAYAAAADAYAAAYKAAYASSSAAADVASAAYAAYAAASAAYAFADVAREAVFVAACQVWLDAL